VDAVDAGTVAELEKVLALYTGELLEGFYDDWVLRERERLRMVYLNGLFYLMRYYRDRGAYEQSLIWGKRVLQEDPLRESIHREIMRLYMASGQRALALQQYKVCADTVGDELGVLPMPETRALYGEIVAGGGNGHSVAAPSRSEPVGLQQALEQLQLAICDFGTAQEQLQRAIQLLERLAEQQ
jgi:DNA-binding SARP family transcriptional activator